MTKEQEAIERLNRFKTIKVLYGNTFAMTTEQLITLQEDIETVLNMLKDLQRENKYMHSELDRQQTTINNYAKEIEKKDKQIDLMAEQIKIPEPTMKIESFDIKPKTKFGMRYLNKEEVKQYFERKAEECMEDG